MYLVNNLISELLRRKSILPRLVIYLFVLVFILTIGITLIFNEIKKKDITKSQLEIEKNRISQIDKQLEILYSKTYSSSDSLFSANSRNKGNYLKQIYFLKNQRGEAVKNIYTINKNPDTEILIFTILTSAITISILTFFTSSFKTSSPLILKEKLDKSLSESRSKFINNNQDFLAWATNNEIANIDLNGLDLEKAKTLKDIYDYSEKLGEKRNDFFNKIIKFTTLKRKQDEIENKTYSEINLVFENIQERLKEECNRLNKQALINLFLCFFIAFILMSFIAYTSIISSDINNQNTLHLFIIKYIPRIIAISSLLTMFLYFAKLYKTNILDVKYYQNELTNIEIKQISLKTALINNEKDVLNKVISDLSNIERNLVLGKDQTTNDIERLKIENEINKDYLNKVWELISITKNKE
ncbi:hypothetical protein [Sphingobacterium sp. MYb382]|uniref:hypothetical protein n=1 Tax=Sphingobacterium sp. MYb382 TaxID=2745278 RepID=UPI0030B0BDCA